MFYRYSDHFLLEFFVFLVLNYRRCRYILDIKLLSIVSFAIIFSHSEGCLFFSLMLSYAVQMLQSFIRSHLLIYFYFDCSQFRSFQSFSCFQLFVTPWTTAWQPPCPSPTPRVHQNPCPLCRWCHLTISSSVVPFSSCPQSLPASGSFQMSQLFMRWPKYWCFSFNISPSNEHPGLISFRTDWVDLLAVQGTLKSLLQHHSSKPSILRCSTSLIVQLSQPYMTTGKTIALTRRTFVGKVMSLFFNMLSMLVITFFSRSKCL